MAYPDTIDTFREIENLPGLTYDPNDKRTFFTEDLQVLRDALIAIETAIGTDPTPNFENIKAALDWLGLHSTPIGAVNWFAHSEPFDGWLICDGQAVSRTEYAGLYAYLGTTWGAGDGSTTFNVPDLREKVLTGHKEGSAEWPNIGSVYGSKTHTLNAAQMPVHGFGWVVHGQENGTDIANQSVTNGSVGGSTISKYGNHGAGFTGATSRQSPSWSFGSGQAHNNIQPTTAGSFRIKT